VDQAAFAFLGFDSFLVSFLGEELLSELPESVEEELSLGSPPDFFL